MATVRALLAAGATCREITARTGVPYSTVLRWHRGTTAAFGGVVPPDPWRPNETVTYAYLLGLYLGDGHVYVAGRGRCLLRIHLDASYPQIVDECVRAVEVVSDRSVRILRREGWNVRIVQCGWKRWPEAFPQHGPGRKHERPIVLQPWQRAIVEEHPGPFVRGLIHSDGCRTVNRFATTLPSGRVAEYAYPRYFFSNLSADIRSLFCNGCDLLGVRWTRSNPRNISVSHRTSVAILDELVGPKR